MTRFPLFAGIALPLLLAAPSDAFEPGEIEAALAVARDVEADVLWLADDAREGRYPGSAGWLASQEYLIDQLEPFAVGLVPGEQGRAAFRQLFLDEGSWGDLVLTNIVAVIPGSDLADEYVVVGGHYDHLTPARCRNVGDDDLCNGANDNAAGTAATLAVARAIAALPAPPRRSIVIALWDDEEYGLDGSRHFVQEAPLVPLTDIAAYVNLDLLGANLAPSARRFSFAVGPETGGALLEQITADAVAAVGLDMRPLSQTFGQDRSDYTWFVAESVPFVFFGDSTNACYHSAADEIELVDFGKLAQQAEIAFRVVLALSESDERPTFVGATGLDRYADLVVLSDVLTSALADLEHISAEPGGCVQAGPGSCREDLVALEATARGWVDAGPGDYVSGAAIVAALGAIDVARFGLPCDATLLPEPDAGALLGAGAVLSLARWRRRRVRRARARSSSTSSTPSPQPPSVSRHGAVQFGSGVPGPSASILPSRSLSTSSSQAGSSRFDSGSRQPGSPPATRKSVSPSPSFSAPSSHAIAGAFSETSSASLQPGS
jgi:hypothetical protein